ncbi:MAG: sulfatase [Verrucomicrobiota bacterium]
MLALAAAPVVGAASMDKPHVLFISIDDLRPDLASFGNAEVVSPNIDRLAEEGVAFRRAYCQQSLCGPSRLSVMTGVYPDGLGIWGMSGGYKIEWRETRSEFTSLPEEFRKNGYKAVGLGKIYDSRLGLDLKHSWDRYDAAWKASYAASDSSDAEKAKNAFKISDKHTGRPKARPAVQSEDVPDDAYSDGYMTNLAIETIASHDFSEPLFLAVGYQKPHLPFVAPQKYWDLYDREALTLAQQRGQPKGFSKYMFSWYKEVESYDVPVPMPVEFERELLHGYYACVSYVDAQIGRIVEALKEKGIYDQTMIVVWGDHGFKLGEFGEWAKHTNLEVDARVPFLIRAPGMKGNGKSSDSLVELVDLFPTLCDLAGIGIPEHVEGKSLVPILRNPKKELRDFALTQYPLVQGTMSYSIRTDEWRYFETRHDVTGEFILGELYRLNEGLFEERNVLDRYPEVARRLSDKLSARLMSAKKWTGPEMISSWGLVERRISK